MREVGEVLRRLEIGDGVMVRGHEAGKAALARQTGERRRRPEASERGTEGGSDASLAAHRGEWEESLGRASLPCRDKVGLWPGYSMLGNAA